MSAVDEDIEPGPPVAFGPALRVDTSPGVVKIVHRSGRVIHTFTGPSTVADGRALIDALCAVFDDSKRLAREVEMLRPWWRFW